MLKAKWCTVQFNAFLQEKMPTQTIKGGNSDEFYFKEGKKETGKRYTDLGTYNKSKMLVEVYPDLAKLVFKFGRWHHHVDYSSFKSTPLIKKEAFSDLQNTSNEYGMKLLHRNKA